MENGNGKGVPYYLVMANSMAGAFMANFMHHQHGESKGEPSCLPVHDLQVFGTIQIISGSPQPRNLLFLCAFALVTDAYGELWGVRCVQCPVFPSKK